MQEKEDAQNYLEKKIKVPWFVRKHEPVSHVHSYSKFFLAKQGIEIWQNEKRILEPILIPWKMIDGVSQPYKFWVENKIEPFIETDIFSKNEIGEYTRRISIEELASLGAAIYSTPIPRKKFVGKTAYYIGGLRSNQAPINYIPKGCWIEYDEPNKAVRLSGTRHTSWYILDFKQSQINKNSLSLKEALLYSRSKTNIIELKRNIKKDIPPNEMVVGISYVKRKLICIPQQRDISRIGIIGKTGEGKSLILHAMGCYLRKWNYFWCHLYDYKNETTAWCLPTGMTENHGECDSEFLTMLNKANIKPNPLPVVWVYPTMSYEQNKPNNKEGINIDMSLSFADVMDNYELIIEGDSSLNLGKAGIWFERDKVKKLKSIEEIHDYIDNGIFKDEDQKIANQKRKQFWPMIEKLKRLTSFIFEKKFVDLSSGVSPNITVKKYIGNYAHEITMPIIPALMWAGLNPILVTQRLEKIRMGKIDITPSYINFIAQQIYDIKRNKEMFRNKYLYILIDELGKLVRSGASGPLIDIATLGRSDGIGLIYANQDWKGIPNLIKQQTDYLFAMRTNDKKEYREICNDFNDDKAYADDIGNLNIKRKFECYLFHREPLIAYDIDTGARSIIQKEPIKIIIMPPMSKHTQSMGMSGS